MKDLNWKPSDYLNKESVPNQLEIVNGTHKIIFWGDKNNTFTNSRGPNSDYSFSGCLPRMTAEEAKKHLVEFMESKKLDYTEFIKTIERDSKLRNAIK